jgi:hypothetical protein
MKKPTEYFLSGAILFGFAIFFYISSSRASEQEFWFGTGGLPPIQIAMMQLAPIIIPILSIVGIVFCALGFKATNEIRPSFPTSGTLPQPPPVTGSSFPIIEKMEMKMMTEQLKRPLKSFSLKVNKNARIDIYLKEGLFEESSHASYITLSIYQKGIKTPIDMKKAHVCQLSLLLSQLVAEGNNFDYQRLKSKYPNQESWHFY